MRFQIMDSYKALSQEVAKEICSLIQEKPEANLCIAAGHSSLGVFEELISLYEKGEVSFAKCSFTAMDEWLGMNREDSGSCGDFLVKNFLSKVDFPEESVSLVNGRCQPPEKELERIRRFIDERHGIDYMLLGIGMNGHLALNEPGTSFDSTLHITQLDAVTQKVGTKYFSDAPVLTGGMTIGLRDICDSGKCVLVINGERKAEIVKKLYDSPPVESLPASVLKTLDNSVVYCDREAASLLSV